MKEGREIFTSSGELESPEEIERKKRVLPSRSGGLEKGPELENFLQRVDFDLLEDIFKKIAEKSDINPETLNLVNRERIFEKSSLGEEGTENAGGYEPVKNIIAFSAREMEKFQQTDFSGIHPDVLKLYILCHEETHATAKTVCKGGFARSRRAEVQMGYQQTKFKKTLFGKRPKQFFEFLNEGVTDKLTREVFQEYTTATAFSNTDELSKFRKKAETYYSPYVTLVDALISKINSETNIPEEVIWKSIIRGMYEGEDLMGEELRQAFDEAISRGFVERLAIAKTADDIESLIGELNAPQ
jgi:hypothetical protein